MTTNDALAYIRDPSSSYHAASVSRNSHMAEYHEADDSGISHDVDANEHMEEDEGEMDMVSIEYWAAPRHKTKKGKGKDEDYPTWRLKTRHKSINAGLFICLNIGVDPPDVVKTHPCAVLETWIDPASLPSTKAIEAIGRNLQAQFESMNPKVKFRPFLDPSVEETKKQCIGLRKVARDERTVFYYNGHGVPKPTASGEIWVFNKNYTQYIPVSLYDLQDWLGTPAVYIWDCSGAGNILNNFGKAAERRDNEVRQSEHPTTGPSYSDAIHLAACLSNQTLPMSPDLPADLFTCCISDPIDTCLRHFVLQDPLRRNISSSPDDPRSRVDIEMVRKMPGELKDRRTPIGELNWIFTAVTDTIAWSSFPRDVFNRLFRQDLLVAALFRNFLLAQRIMGTYHVTPTSIPELPNTSNHPLWNSWDLAVDACLAQLPAMIDQQEKYDAGLSPLRGEQIYKPSNFFAQHLQAFEVWLAHGSSSGSTKLTKEKLSHRPPPEQLPIVLQVLLSQAHRLRALILLSRFVDLGPWAVHLSLSIGIFPYVQKLLQSPAIELKPVLIFIWARILAIDKSCQVDLLREQGYEYFAKILSPFSTNTAGQPLSIPNQNEHRAMCAFILSTLCRNFKSGQTACLAIDVYGSCMTRLQEDDWLLKTWSLLCIAQLWADNDEAKSHFTSGQHGQLLEALRSTAVEVRAAALYAFATFLGASAAPAESTDFPGGGGTGAQLSMNEIAQLELEAGLAFACMMLVKEDASPMVRKELVVVISCVVREWRGWFVCAAFAYYEHEAFLSKSESGEKPSDKVMVDALRGWLTDPRKSQEEHERNKTLLSSFKILFETLLDLSVDPCTEVALMASTVVDYIVALLLDSAFTRVKDSVVQELGRKAGIKKPETNGTPPIRRTNTEDKGLQRSSSVATALKSFATMTGLISDDTSEMPTPRSLPEALPTTAPNYTSPYPDPDHPRTQPDYQRTPSLNSVQRIGRSGLLQMSTPLDSQRDPVEPWKVLDALTEEDMDNLRLRRGKGRHAGSDSNGSYGNNGLARPNELILGTVARQVKDDVLPLRSGFYDWAVEYFKEAQMTASDADEPGSLTFNHQAWKHVRNEKLLESSRMSEDYASRHSWSEEVANLHNDSPSLQLAFHSYDPLLAVTDDADGISMWDWKHRRLLNRFSNQNVIGSSISGLHFINEMSNSLLLTASTEGSVRIWRGFDEPGKAELASTFRAVSELHPVGHSSGVLTAWEQHKGHLLVGGDMKVVRLWDATVERHLRDIATQAGSNLTAIAADEPDGNIFVAGFGDGVVRLFDKRAEDSESVVLRTWRQHHTWIQSIHLQKGGQRELLTGSMNGEVRIWDVRRPDAPLFEAIPQKQGLMALGAHPGAPVFATSSMPTPQSQRQKILVQGFSNPEKPINLSTILIPLTQAYGYTPKVLMPSATSLLFHPVEMVLAAGRFDSTGTVKIFRCDVSRREEDQRRQRDKADQYAASNGNRRVNGYQ